MRASLSDFAKIVEVLDAASASFVSITQSFNTTTSMGRLKSLWELGEKAHHLSRPTDCKRAVIMQVC